MPTLLQQVRIGMGQAPNADRDGLSPAERRRVARLVRRGEAAWDARSARAAVALARRIGLSSPVGVVVISVVLGSTAALCVLACIALGMLTDPVGLASIALLLAIGPVAWWAVRIDARSRRGAARALEGNLALLDATDLGSDEADPPFVVPAADRISVIVAVAFCSTSAAIVFGALAVVSGDGPIATIGGILQGAIFGGVFVAFSRYAQRQLARRDAEARPDAYASSDVETPGGAVDEPRPSFTR